MESGVNGVEKLAAGHVSNTLRKAEEQEEECGGEEEGNEQDEDETVPVMIILAPAVTFGWDGKQDAILCSIHVCSALASLLPPYIHAYRHTHTSKHTLAEQGRSLWFQSSDSGL